MTEAIRRTNRWDERPSYTTDREKTLVFSDARGHTGL